MGEQDSGRKHLLPLLAIGAIATACGIALGLLINWFPPPASEEAGPIDTLWDVLLIVSVPIFVLTQTIVLYSVWRFRMRPGEELEDGPPIHGNTRLEVIWTAVPAIILVALCSYAYVVLRDIEKAEANEMKVRVVGEQFTWTFYYPGGGGGKEIASNQLYLPKGKAIRLRRPVQGRPARLLGARLPSEDRRGAGHHHPHPRAAGQDRHVPGRLRRAVRARPLRHAPERPRRAPGRLRQVAGGHEDEGGRRRRAGRRGTAAAARPPTARRSSASGASPACGSCHTLADAGATGTIGPNLDKVLKGKDAAFIQQSIEDPGAVRREGLPGRHHAHQLRRHPPAGGDQGADRLPCEGREQVMERRVMAARLRAPGLARAGLFVVLGVLFAAVIVTLARPPTASRTRSTAPTAGT